MPDPVLPDKKWYASKTLWGIVIAGVAIALGWAGKPEIAANVQIEQESVLLIVEKIAAIVGLLLALYGRLVAKTTLVGK